MPLDPSRSVPKAMGRITAKELGQFFRAPIAWLFLGAFLLISLFIFFWVEAFFARNIADVRPLFEWMPLLLIFLSAALTMKMWSEERRSGTLEHVLTQPVALWQFVLGKFFACWALVALALLLTLPLPITVSLLGDLDWGPVLSGYVAALLLGGAYLSMGLFVSARCDNQIVSLILTVALASLFYLVGSSMVTGWVGTQTAELMRNLGTGSRFESITRGVLDFRDLYYYLSLIAVFLALNIYALERGRWAADGNRRHHRFWRWGTALVVGNMLVANLWLTQVTSLRWDTTQGKLYSISEATRGYLAQLQEPILIRGYFSQKTHPLLAPLVPQLQDLLREYEIVGRGRVRVELIDPTANPELEDEANNRFNIRPTPFRVSDRHQAAVVNSYFDVLIQYGDEHKVLSFSDLIEVRSRSESDLSVHLRNPEYDLTRMIKNTLYAYQSGGDPFAGLQQPLELTAYISADARLPEELVALRRAMVSEVESVKARAGDRFVAHFIDPDADGGAVGRRISEEFGFTPMSASMFDDTRFYFYITLGYGDQLMLLPLGDFTEGAFKSSLDVGIKRFAGGFTRTVALVTPKQPDTHFNRGELPRPHFEGLRQMFGETANVISEDLSGGSVNPTADILVLAAPVLDDDVELFAVDQFLMRGGTVVVATSPFSAQVSRSHLSVTPYTSGLTNWLASLGITMEEQLVMDRQNSAFPVPTIREVGGMRFQEMQLVDYPYFIDVRGDGFNNEVPITADLPQVTVPWASPIVLDDAKLEGLKVTSLLNSSPRSWLADASEVMPSPEQVRRGYQVSGEQRSHLLAVAVEGRFQSVFAGQESPRLRLSDAGQDEESASYSAYPVINHSAESARLVVLASNDLFRDEIIGMLGSVSGGVYLNSLQLLENTVDWALEDQGLLTIRSRGQFNRTLVPMAADAQEFWEYLNYALVVLGLLILWGVWRYLRRAREARYRQWLAA